VWFIYAGVGWFCFLIGVIAWAIIHGSREEGSSFEVRGEEAVGGDLLEDGVVSEEEGFVRRYPWG
jgi:hypothetical protein